MQTLFRSNSMASKAVDYYMKMVGSDYLKGLLSNFIQQIVTSTDSCEVCKVKLNTKIETLYYRITGGPYEVGHRRQRQPKHEEPFKFNQQST
jgi:hypothetical protein